MSAPLAISGTGAASRRRSAPAALLVCVAALVLAVAGGGLAWADAGVGGVDAGMAAVQVVTGLAYAALAVVLLAREDARRLGRLMAAIGLCNLLAAAGQGYADHGTLVAPGSLPGAAWGLLPALAWIPALGLSATALVLLFPDGRPPSPRWRPVLWLGAGAIALAVVVTVTDPSDLPAGEHAPFDLPGLPDERLWLAAVATAFLLAAVLSVAGLVVRMRRATGTERAQLRWFALGATVLVLAVLSEIPFPRAEVAAEMLGLLCLPAAAAIAMLRHQLYDVDVVLTRSLVYGGLTALVVGGYAAMVAVFELLLDHHAGFGASVVASGAVALAFGPLRAWLQRGAERLVYGQRADPYGVLAGLGRRLEATADPGAAMPAVVDTVADALRLPHVAIALRAQDGRRDVVAVRGTPVGEPLVLPLTHGGSELGELTVSPRGPGEGFTAAERDLLGDLARQAGAAAQAVQLNDHLRRSRVRLVAAREEERRRLRRDLHDGLGPTLASVTLRLDGVRRRLRQDPDAAAADLVALRTDVQEAIGGIRDLVYELRPPALDELGLAGALRERAGRFAPLRVTVQVQEPLAPLPAAVEVAAYRIALEALTNVVRHARARRAVVELRGGEALVVLVRDDGRGFAAGARPGVGLASMRERAEELGGRLDLAADATGATITAHLPLP